MATIGTVRARLIPWDDPGFIAAFERVADRLRAAGVALETPAECDQLQSLLRAEGYPDATVECNRNVDEALSHRARIVVHRDAVAA